MSRRAMLSAAVLAVGVIPSVGVASEPIHVGFLWHMHQPIYYPGENVVQTTNANRFSFSLYDVHNQRVGPYTSWPKDAVQKGLHLPNLGTQVSFSGSLIENLNTLRNNGIGGGMWNNWNASYSQAKSWSTAEGNTRMDMIGFNYHHALSPLLDERDLRMQIRMHKVVEQQTFGGSYSKGYFPAETAFHPRMIPALKAEGFEWTLFDSIHLERAMKTYPHTNASGLYAPNRADQINPAPSQWVQLNNLWAPSKVAAPEGYRPSHIQYVNPNTGNIQTIVGVPAARYEGNEDGRGGYGAFLYQQVMDQYRQYNTDPARPMLVVLHHDGDNYGGGSEAYYGHNFQNMVNWATGNANYNVSTIQDYLEKFPVPQNAVVHVEPGSWAGADNGDPQFLKWMGKPNAQGWSPDHNSWAVLTAAKNRVFTAEDLIGPAQAQNVINNTGTAAERAWHYLTQAQASDHWYWDGTEIWDSNVTRGSNLAAQRADERLGAGTFTAAESTGPTVFLPQRSIYNPGAFEFGTSPEPTDFEVFTFAYDVSGMTSVTLKWRFDHDGENPLDSIANETYAGGAEVSEWQSIAMNSSQMVSPQGIAYPLYRANRYGAMITGQVNRLVDYYVEAVDARGNITRTDIQHVWIGPGDGSTGDFIMNGQLDPNAQIAAQNGAMTLHYKMKDGRLYIAAPDAGEGQDRFIFVARSPGQLINAPWAKSGQVAAYDLFLADENDNGFSGFFNASGQLGITGASGTATGTNGGVVEGWFDLRQQFGGLIPHEIWLAVASYNTADGGTLVPSLQVPASMDGNTTLNASEFIRIQLLFKGDVNLDGSVNNLDIAPFVQLLTGGTMLFPESPWLGDINNDGVVNNLDIAPFVQLLTGGRGIASDDPRFAPLLGLVPEPGMLGTLVLTFPMLLRRRARRAR